MDFDQHHIHVWLLHYVPLRPRRAVRIQLWSIRQSEHVGADRQRCSIHADQEIPHERANRALPSKHSLHALRLGVLHHQLSSRARSGYSQTTFCKTSFYDGIRWQFRVPGPNTDLLPQSHRMRFGLFSGVPED